MKATFVSTIVIMFTLLTTVACSSNSPTGSQTISARAPGLSFVDDCRRKGGKWTRDGTLIFFGCLLPAKDAGKVCTDSSQCEYHCNAPAGAKLHTGQMARGQCQATNSYKGCHTEIVNGIALKERCIKI